MTRDSRTALARLMLVAALLGIAPSAGGLLCPGFDIELSQAEGVYGIVVENEGGSLIPGATVTVTRGKFERSTVTDEDGYFRLGKLAPGNYEMRVELEGLDTAQEEIRIRPHGGESGHALIATLAVVTTYSCPFIESKPWKEVRDRQLEKVVR